jgi:hypothetical protein
MHGNNTKDELKSAWLAEKINFLKPGILLILQK